MSQKIAFLFPGQGSQSVGMCRDLYESSGIFRDVIHEIQDITYRSIWPIINEGPERELKKTVNCQLALFAVSLATMKVVLFEKPHLKPSFCAGMSLGEYSALCAAQVLELREAVELVEKRAELMQQACETVPGKMIAVVGLTKDLIEALLLRLENEREKKCDLYIANYNALQQVVLAGSSEAVEAFCKIAMQNGARKIVELDVAGAFHSPLMGAAADQFKPYLKTANFKISEIKVVSNVTGQEVIYNEDFRELLEKQITSTVLWYPSIHYLAEQKVDLFIELGPGRVLHGLNYNSIEDSIDRNL
jgi:[acyl-carrier-protein] S-malonyltransferase